MKQHLVLRTLTPEKTFWEKLFNQFAERRYLVSLNAENSPLWGRAPEAQYFDTWEEANTFARSRLPAVKCEAIPVLPTNAP